MNDPFYIIENSSTLIYDDGRPPFNWTSCYQYSLTGNHRDGGNVFGTKESAKRFESKVKATRIAREMNKMRPNEKYTVVEVTPQTQPA